MTTWNELKTLQTGARVRFNFDHDIFPYTIIREGTMATVVRQGLTDDYPVLEVLPDDTAIRNILDEWDGAIMLYPFDSGTAHPWDDAAPIDIA